MTNNEFVSRLKKVLTLKTIYVNGGFGAPAGYGNNRDKYIENYSKNQTAVRANKIRNADADTYFFDCVCLGKGILWGFDADPTRIYGGALYCSNGVPDFSTEDCIHYCADVSDDMRHIEVGEWLYKPGHVGYYIGDGKVIECTVTSSADGVQLRNITDTPWISHGKLQYIEYGKPSIVCPCCGCKFVLE